MASQAERPAIGDWAAALIALLAALLVLYLAGWLDTILLFQRKLAYATLEYTPLFWAYIGTRLLLVAAWTGLAWLVMVRMPRTYLTGAIYLMLGVFILVSPYAGTLAGVPVARLNWVAFANDFINFSGAFIAVLGLLILTKGIADRDRFGSEGGLEG